MKKKSKLKKKTIVRRTLILIILISLFVIIGIQYNKINNKDPQTDPKIVNPRPVTDTLTIRLYFENKGVLVGEERNISIQKDENIPKRVVEELIKGPNNKQFSPTIPNGTRVNSVKVVDNTAIVDLSKEFIDNYHGGSEAENLIIYSVVNTLTELININKVQFLIDGETRIVFKHFTLDETFKKDESLITQ